jgi:hypothetical protein
MCFLLAPQLQKSNIILNIGLTIMVSCVAMLIGPLGFGVVDSAAIESFEVLASLGLGVVGFILGIKFRLFLIKFSQEVFTFLPKYLFMFFVITGILIFLNEYLPLNLDVLNNFKIPVDYRGLDYVFYSNYELLWIAFILGLSSITTSFVVDYAYLKKFNIEPSVKTRIFELKSISAYIAIVFLGIVLSAYRGVDSSDKIGLSILEWSTIAAFSGVFCGIVFSIFLGTSKDEERIYLATIGAILFSCGIGHALGVSSLFVNFVFAVTLALTSKNSELIEKNITRLLYPAYILLFFLAGLNFSDQIGGFIYFIPIYLLLRLAFNFFIIKNNHTDAIVEENPFTRNIGSLFVGQDLLPIAIGLSCVQSNQTWGTIAISILLPATLINLCIGHLFARKYLIDVSVSSTSVESSLVEKSIVESESLS